MIPPNKNMLTFAIPQFDLMLSQAKDRSDIPAYVKDAARGFVDALKRWRDEPAPGK